MTDDARPQGFDTIAIHAGSAPDPATGARQVPIYQTTAYQFRDADHAAALFNLQEVGYIYSRLTNPTVSALQARLAALEGGAGAVCCSSGHAAQIMALFPLTFGSSMFASADTMPGWLRAWVKVNPVTHLTDAVRSLLTGGAAAQDAFIALGTAALILAVFAPLAVRAYRTKA